MFNLLNPVVIKFQYFAYFIVIVLLNQLTYSQNNDLKKYIIPIENLGINNSNLRTDGFYYTKYMNVNENNDTIRFIGVRFLYTDGSMINMDTFGDGAAMNETVRQNGKKCILDSIGRKSYDRILEYTACALQSKKYRVKKNYGLWSFFSTNEKSIKIQHYHNKGRLVHNAGIIINDTTFVLKKRTIYNTQEIKDIYFVNHFYKTVKPDFSKVKPLKFYKQKISPE